MESEQEIKKKFEDFKEQAKRTTLQISRIPEKYKTRFMEISKEEFSNDYGMCLREMIRTWDGVYTSSNDEIHAKLDLLGEQVSKLKQEKEKPKPKGIKMADGTMR